MDDVQTNSRNRIDRTGDSNHIRFVTFSSSSAQNIPLVTCVLSTKRGLCLPMFRLTSWCVCLSLVGNATPFTMLPFFRGLHSSNLSYGEIFNIKSGMESVSIECIYEKKQTYPIPVWACYIPMVTDVHNLKVELFPRTSSASNCYVGDSKPVNHPLQRRQVLWFKIQSVKVRSFSTFVCFRRICLFCSQLNHQLHHPRSSNISRYVFQK